jgi:hypothetical protein
MMGPGPGLYRVQGAPECRAAAAEAAQHGLWQNLLACFTSQEQANTTTYLQQIAPNSGKAAPVCSASSQLTTTTPGPGCAVCVLCAVLSTMQYAIYCIAVMVR